MSILDKSIEFVSKNSDKISKGIKIFFQLILDNDSPFKLKELADVYSKNADKLILRQENTDNYQYIGGEFKIYYLDEKKFGISISLYFQDKNKQWQKASAKSEDQPARKLERSALAELKEKGTVVFNIDRPKNPGYPA
ncbi:hypothetical protein [Pectinatus haikarae]|uniref:Uncharacterized protein n=1 Tax=Pectinatus haikarae TaxID=349096 RepID=A0ABT9Y4U4_9FIRM|nr:hypothetical protein [Pectinatus haikarae]MDQ0202853.1 hypothetical protein [Pectinatus haikarae]